MSTITRRDSLLRVVERQWEVGLANLERIAQVVAGQVTAVMTSFADYGMQTGPFISLKTYHNDKTSEGGQEERISRLAAWRPASAPQGQMRLCGPELSQPICNGEGSRGHDCSHPMTKEQQ